jgi:hypothetical protein
MAVLDCESLLQMELKALSRAFPAFKSLVVQQHRSALLAESGAAVTSSRRKSLETKAKKIAEGVMACAQECSCSLQPTGQTKLTVH